MGHAETLASRSEPSCEATGEYSEANNETGELKASCLSSNRRAKNGKSKEGYNGEDGPPTVRREETVTVKEKVRRLRAAAQTYVPNGPRVRDHAGLAALIREGFDMIADLRQRDWSWRDIVGLMKRAQAAPLELTVDTLRGTFNREQRARLAIAGKRQPPDTRYIAPQILTASPAPRVEEQQELSQLPEAKSTGKNVIRLPDGREFPVGTTEVPLTRVENWAASDRHRYYGGRRDAPYDPPMVPIEQLLKKE